MKIEVKGHSGCQIDVVNEDNNVFVYKSTVDPKYLSRLVLQAEKQKAASEVEYQHIRVPKVYDIKRAEDRVVIKMQYIYSKNFVEFFEQAGFEQVDYLIGALKYFVEYEISKCKIESIPAEIFQEKFAEIKGNCLRNSFLKGDMTILNILDKASVIFDKMGDIIVPVGLCHGDLTFSNILFNGNNYYLIDFLDSFIESPLQDIVKLRQDTAHRWSQLMYKKHYDAVRMHIVLDKVDKELDGYFAEKYQWYREHYHVMQLMNMLRILPYAHEGKVVEYLKNTIQSLLEGLDKDETEEDISQTFKIKNKSNNCSLIVPVAADKPEYANDLPYVFGLDKDGVTICLKCILGMNIEKFDNIYFSVLQKHEEKFYIVDSLKLQFQKLGIKNAKVVVLEEPTRDQAETVFKTIEKESIVGSIFIKDADCFFEAEYVNGNGVAIFPIESLDILAPKDKSYVAVDDMYYLTNIIEKSVVGHYISAGGYAIDDVDSFLHCYSKLRSYGKLYLSHIVYAMLLEKKTFRPLLVEEYRDWGSSRIMNIV